MNAPKTRLEPQLSAYLHSKGRRLGLPIAGNFELTARCNFNCPMCYVHLTGEQLAASGKQEQTAAQWLELARQARDKGMLFALLTGGEPLVRKDFFEIYDGMKALGLVVSINSNGSMLQGEILQRFLQDPPFRFNISLYGGSNETYREMCGQPAYEQVKENIRALRKAGVDVSINLSITPHNCRDVAQIYADAKELDVNVKASSYMYPSVRVNGEQYGCGSRLTAEEAAYWSVQWDALRFTEEQFALRAQNLAKITAETDCPLEEEDGVRCRAGSSSFWLTWDGRMLPCGMMTRPEAYPLRDGFEAAWEQTRRATAAIRTPAACSVCPEKEACGMCAALCYAETGAFDRVPDYLCRKTREQLRLTAALYEERTRK